MPLHSEPVISFGDRRKDKVYKERPGAYGFAFDGPDKVALVRTPAGLFVPGGGVDHGETEPMALTREFREETGLSVDWHGFLVRVRQHVTKKGPGSLEKLCSYYLVRWSVDPSARTEHDHELLWTDIATAKSDLTLEADRWAVELAETVVRQAAEGQG